MGTIETNRAARKAAYVAARAVLKQALEGTLSQHHRTVVLDANDLDAIEVRLEEMGVEMEDLFEVLAAGNAMTRTAG